MFTNNMESPHANKRKQDCLGFATVDEVIPSEQFNWKKQRLSFEQHSVNGEQMQYSRNNIAVINGFAQMNDHTQANHIGTNGDHLQEMNATGEMVEGANRVSEAMECSEQQDSLTKAEVNGNLMPTAYGKYCPHGHLNMCTTYNVPCRYPRMYCHPGGMLEDRLAIYHGF